jgi:hypothetical protein
MYNTKYAVLNNEAVNESDMLNLTKSFGQPQPIPQSLEAKRKIFSYRECTQNVTHLTRDNSRILQFHWAEEQVE